MRRLVNEQAVGGQAKEFTIKPKIVKLKADRAVTEDAQLANAPPL